MSSKVDAIRVSLQRVLTRLSGLLSLYSNLFPPLLNILQSKP